MSAFLLGLSALGQHTDILLDLSLIFGYTSLPFGLVYRTVAQKEQNEHNKNSFQVKSLMFSKAPTIVLVISDIMLKLISC